jgi:regulator of replication initiation timing
MAYFFDGGDIEVGKSSLWRLGFINKKSEKKGEREMIHYLIRVSVIAFIVPVFLCFSSVPGESAELNSADILKRLNEMGQKIEQMGGEIEALKKENKELKTQLEILGLKKENRELKAKLDEADRKKDETEKTVAAKVEERPPVKVEPLIPKPFKGGFQAEAEYMYLTVNRDAAPYAGKLSEDTTIDSISIDAEDETEFDKDGAWRFGLSYVSPSGWDVGAKFTRFETDGENSIGKRGEDNDDVWVNRLNRSLADDVLNRDFDDGIADYAEEKLEFEYDIWDAELGHTFRTSDYTALRLFGGFRYIDMENNSMITYENWETGDYQVAEIENRLEMDGYGGRVGGSFVWDIFDTGLSFNFGSALSLVYANFDITRKDNYETTTDRGYRKVTMNLDSFLPIIDLDVALKYQYKWFFVEGGYLFSYWWNGDLKQEVVGWDDVDGTTSPYHYEKSDLSFHGWKIRAGFIF